jgi:thioredoxin reductase
MKERYETVIVGAGPAGLSAALVLGRCMRSTLVCDSGRYRNERSQALHCYMGQDGVPPGRLLTLGREQLRPYETVEIIQATASRIQSAPHGFALATDAGLLSARTVLVATGVVDKLPNIEGIHELFGRSVHVCPYCDGWEHRNAPVAAFGKGEKGAGLALLLRQWTEDLVLCTHGDAELSGQDRKKLGACGIAVREEPIARLEGKDGCLQVIVFADGARLARRALFFNTGQHPRSTLLEELGCRYVAKGIKCDDDGQTSVPGVYVAGDVSRDVQLAIVAAAEGARAALAINRALLQAGDLGRPHLH